MNNNFTGTLLAWYEEHKRDLPWRETRDPYLIWISEVILQQTRVAQGYEYYLRFVRRFPDVRTLADADGDEVMKYWQGLGYYSRARNLHEAARSMNGTFPRTYDGVRALKGVGDYTAAAICSIAYDLPYAVVDGNVYRVLARYFGIDTPIDSGEGRKLFAALAQEMLDKVRPALYNQAIMDFGALQCTPQSPACMFCPLADSCTALAQGTVQSLPVKSHKTKVTHRYFQYLFVRKGGQILLHKRTEGDIWQNLYELPLIETDGDVEEEAFRTHPRLLEWCRPDELQGLRLLKAGVRHVLSHRIIHANFYGLELSADSPSLPGYLSVCQQDVPRYAVPRLIHEFLEAVL